MKDSEPEVYEIPLSRGFVAIVDPEDYERVMAFRWYAKPHKQTCYGARKIRKPGMELCNGTLYLHRFILHVYDNREVDHINGNGLDCRKVNMRIANDLEQARNKRISRGRSRFKGVRIDGAKFIAFISFEGKAIRLGEFNTEEEAAKAYNLAAIDLFEEFAALNQV